MNQQLIDTVVNAVLYEGCTLYPYRASAKKNRPCFTFGRVYPEAYSHAQLGAEPCAMQTQCLVEGRADEALLHITVRFLHPILRDIGALAVPLRNMPAADNPDFFHVVPELTVDGRHYTGWQEAAERSVPLPAVSVAGVLGAPRRIPFSFPSSRTIEPIRDHCGYITGVIVREQSAVKGSVELAAEPVDGTVTKLTVRILNQTPEPRRGFDDNDDLVMRTFASTHTILHVRNGAFLSLIDPPAAHAATAQLCRNLGAWPILIGDEAAQQRDTLVASPVILYDYPRVDAESSGESFDGEGGESAMPLIEAPADDHKRTGFLPRLDLLRMHGVTRNPQTVTEEA